jgi:hypothetical protein
MNSTHLSGPFTRQLRCKNVTAPALVAVTLSDISKIACVRAPRWTGEMARSRGLPRSVRLAMAKSKVTERYWTPQANLSRIYEMEHQEAAYAFFH